MNSLLVSAISYDTMRRIRGIVSPDSQVDQGLISSLSTRERSTLLKVSEMIKSICLSAGVEDSHVTLKLSKEGTISCEGSSSKTVIRFGVNVLKGIASREKKSVAPFLQAYEKAIHKFPNSPQKIEALVQRKSDKFLHAYRGLHNICHLMLSDDEIRFILAHEIKGHSVHGDNSSKVVLFLTVALTAFVALNILMQDYPAASVLACSLVLAKVASIPYSRGVELTADSKALIGDASAKEGARLYFKRYLIAEKVQAELERREKGRKSVTSTMLDIVESAGNLEHPSPATRLQQVLKIYRSST